MYLAMVLALTFQSRGMLSSFLCGQRNYKMQAAERIRTDKEMSNLCARVCVCVHVHVDVWVYVEAIGQP